MNTLIAKLAAASTAVGALMPDKTNTAQNYSYISADKILQRAGDALSNQGIVILPRIVNESVTEISYTDGYGKAKTKKKQNTIVTTLKTRPLMMPYQKVTDCLLYTSDAADE